MVPMFLPILEETSFLRYRSALGQVLHLRLLRTENQRHEWELAQD